MKRWRTFLVRLNLLIPLLKFLWRRARGSDEEMDALKETHSFFLARKRADCFHRVKTAPRSSGETFSRFITTGVAWSAECALKEYVYSRTLGSKRCISRKAHFLLNSQLPSSPHTSYNPLLCWLEKSALWSSHSIRRAGSLRNSVF